MTDPSHQALSDDSDPFDAEVLLDPHPFYDRVRATAPACYLAGRDVWMVAGYQHAFDVLSNYRDFVSSKGVGHTRVAEHGYRYPLIDTDPPEHTRVRRAVQEQFSRAAMDLLRPQVRDAVNMLLDRLLQTGEGDFVSQVAHPLADQTIRLLTGLTPPDQTTFSTWGDAVGQLGAPDLCPHLVELATASLEWLKSTGVPAAPQGCMARSIMDNGGDNGGLVAEGPERLMTLDSIWLAGSDSSSSLLGNAINAFLDFPEQWERVRSNPELIPNAVDEVLRWDSPFRMFYRRTTEPVGIGGVAIPADADVCVMLGAANRDPAKFEHPHRFDVGRAEAKAHLAFGTSVHLCIGAPAARLEAIELLTAMARRVRRFERAGSATRARNQTMRKFESLPVRLALS
jgi:cytochrome P450